MDIQLLQENLSWIVPLVVVELILKPFALWRAAQRGSRGWFVLLFLFNTAGILPAVYLLLDRKQPAE